VTQPVGIKPKREIDPYILAEMLGSRMPTNSQVFKQRDLVGEVGWIPNFEQKKSKNNENRHVLTREFFD
jgi:hypothetical protein